jgi:ABC-type multidrug transport system fused ATPase/permease subunit
MICIKGICLESVIARIKKIYRVNQFCLTVSRKASKAIFLIRITMEFILVLLTFCTIFLSKEIIDLFVSLSAGKANVSDGIRTLTVLAFVLFVISYINRLLQQAKEYYSGLHQDLISNYINCQIAQKTAFLDMNYFDSPKFFDELTNAKRDSYALQTLTWFTIDIIRCSIQFILSTIILARFNVLFAAVLIITGIPAIVTERKFTKIAYNWQRGRVPEERKMGYTLEILTGKRFVKDIRLYGLQNYFLSKYKILWDKWFNEKRKILFDKSKYMALFSILPELGMFGMNLYIAINIALRKLTVGDYSLYNGTINQLLGSIYSFAYLIGDIRENNLKLENYRNFLSWENSLPSDGNIKVDSKIRIDFVNVSFKYPGVDRYILKKINFSILEGEKVAIVGENGSGKTTIIKLLLRYYDPTEGEIAINGIDIRKYDINELRKCFSVLFQDYTNYAFTIRDNITLSDLNHKDDEDKIIEACHKSGVSNIAEKFEDGFDTYLTREFEENGKELSGGEWQKIALARTFFRNGRIIILDEPSASLDPESEYKVFNSFNELCKGKGAIFISHRLSNVTMADKIFVIDKGSVLESGTHNELIKKAGKYAYLFNLQAEKYKVG